jgi:hypothetical protein
VNQTQLRIWTALLWRVNELLLTSLRFGVNRIDPYDQASRGAGWSTAPEQRLGLSSTLLARALNGADLQAESTKRTHFWPAIGPKRAEDTKRIQPQIAYGLMGIDSPAIELIDENGGGPGVRLRKRHQKKG